GPAAAMRSRVPTALGVMAGTALVLLAGVVLFGFPSSAPAQKGTPAAPPDGGEYVGAETCKGCHEEAFQTFSHTKMGRLFLHQPRNTTEGLACENCHGPGKAHVEAGGGKGKGGLITFAKNDPTPIEKR